MTLQEILISGSKVINDLIKKEHTAQGHHLTGTLERSLEGEVIKNNLIGRAVYYAKTLNEGVLPENISSKSIPGLVKYFILRGLNPQDAQRAAFLTFRKWKREGMSTQASKRFSKTGGRQNFIEAAFLNPEIDQHFISLFDFAVDEQYKKNKSETI